jgi:hypothetical protein
VRRKRGERRGEREERRGEREERGEEERRRGEERRGKERRGYKEKESHTAISIRSKLEKCRWRKKFPKLRMCQCCL